MSLDGEKDPRAEARAEAREADAQLRASAWYRAFRWLLDRRFLALVFGALVAFAGLVAMPFAAADDGWLARLPRDPVAVDALPDVSVNQQIVFTRWAGRSPEDIEDQITFPLGTAMLGLGGVESIRSASMFGFSSIHVVFADDVDFYWARNRILEKLDSLPPDALPPGVTPTLGPDATALGQVFWYTLEAQDSEGQVVGGAFGLEELRELQDWQIRYALEGVGGVAEVASIGGFVREYQVDVDPGAMRTHGVTLAQVANAVRGSSVDVGARTLEINGAEYLVRGLGQLRDTTELENSVVEAHPGFTPVRVGDVARVSIGPALRRGALDDAGAPAVGGVVTVRQGDNPREVIEGVRARIEELAPALPRRVMPDGTVAQVRIVPFYDRSGLIDATLDTLAEALREELLIAAVVVLLLLGHLRSAAVIGLTLPLAVLGAFALMKGIGVDANVMSLAGIAIAIGTMVDVGIVFTESVVRRTRRAPASGPERLDAIALGAAEVGPAVLTSLATTVISFLPIFALQGPEGRLFGPLAATKTLALLSTMVIGLVLLPVLIELVFARVDRAPRGADEAPRPLAGTGVGRALVFDLALAGVGVVGVASGAGWIYSLVVVAAALRAARVVAPAWASRPLTVGANLVLVGLGLWTFDLRTVALVFAVVSVAAIYRWGYAPLLRLCLRNPGGVIAAKVGVVGLGLMAWWGAPPELSPGLARTFPGIEADFMPPFDEGSLLFMPTTAQHASIGSAVDMLSELDAAIAEIPEVRRVVGKLGRAETALDPAPVSMFEVMVDYWPEYGVGPDGQRVRNWRPEIRSPDDIWREVERVGARPGLTGAPRLMPIETRLVMLRTGMRASVGIKVQGPDLESIEGWALEAEQVLRHVDAIDPGSVVADRVVGKPYLEIHLDREALARHGLTVREVFDTLEIAVGGQPAGVRIEGRVRHDLRIRYPLELRGSVEALQEILVSGGGGETVPLGQLAEVRYAPGPQLIRSEDTFLTAFVTFEPAEGRGPMEAVAAARVALEEAEASGSLPRAEGVSYRFAGTYEDVLRSQARLALLVPVALALILALLYLQFGRLSTALLVFVGVALAGGGGFLMLWAWGAPGLFDLGTPRLTVAVWVGFLAVFGIATDDGVLMATYLHARVDPLFAPGRARPTWEALEGAVVQAGQRRVRACLMTTATTILALLPLLTGDGPGSDLMLPMALPIVGGVVASLLTLVTVPVLFALGAWISRDWGMRR